ncbi:MAG: putative membrane protein YecN with MAPEG domain [Paraglaciecola sp.]|jgi:uncharacterized membrane protein YecN with MAPEG domain
MNIYTPITAFYAGLLAMLFLYLSALVIANRRNKKISLGYGGDKHFLQFIRAHGNFSEYVPLVLVMQLIAEINNSSDLLLHFIGVTLLFGRLIHSFGLRRHTGASWQRVVGMLLTFVSMIIAAVINLTLLY